LSATPALGVVVAAESTKWSSAPELNVTEVTGELAAVHVRQTVVTV
jgi:hypothetical protein